MLDPDVGPGIAQAFLEGAHIDVAGGDLREDHDQRVAIGLDGGHVAGLRRLDRTPHPAPQVELPAGVDAQLEDLLGLGIAPDHGVALAVGGRAPDAVHLGDAGALRDAETRARAAHPGGRLLQVVALFAGALDQVVQDGILEDRPPGLQIGFPGGETVREVRVPLVGLGALRRLIVRAHRAAEEQSRGGR